MTKTQTKQNSNEVEYTSLGLTQEQEADRYKIGTTPGTMEALRITHIRFDEKTRYFDKRMRTGTPIVKINGLNLNSDQIKLLSLSDVIYHNMKDIIEAVGAKEIKDENNIVWFELSSPVRIAGFEQVKVEKGKNPYIRIKTN